MESLAFLELQEIFTPAQTKLVKIILILLAALIVSVILRLFIKKFTAKTPKRLATLLVLLNSLVSLTIATVAGLTILTELGINITPILASAGVAGLAIGFGAQTLVRDLISGIFLLAEDQIRLGDIVRIGDVEGELQKISLRTISIRDFSGNLVIVPNSDVSKIINLTREWSQIDLKIPVSDKNPVDDVLEIIGETAAKFSKDKNYSKKLLSPLEVLGIEEITGGKMTVRIVGKTKPRKQFNLQRAFLYQLKKAFEEKGIEFS